MKSLITECKNPEEMIRLLRTIRIQRRKRIARLRTITFICIVSTLLLAITVFATNHKPKTQVSYKTVVIEEGDTLWEYAKKYYPDREIRSAIYELKKINNLKDSTIYEGQTIKVPDTFDKD